MKNKKGTKKDILSKTKNFKTKDFVPVKNNNSNKRRIKYSKGNNTLWTSWLLICVFILVLTALKLGIVATLLVSFVMAFISGIAYLLQSTKGKTKKKKLIHIILIIMLSMFIVGLLLFGAFLVYITVSSADKYDPKKLNTKELTILYDKDGKEYARLGAEKREKVSYDELPQVLIDAIVSTEDSRYFQHNGFDAPRFLKATLGQLLHRSTAGGASTLSMQVVKNSLTSTESHGIQGIIRKFTDIYLAVFKLEKNYTKEEIIEFYVNNHMLGGVIYGVEEASRAYFNKSVSDLNLSEAAIIAGMFKAPNYYRPNVNPKNAAARRKTVLYLMRRHGYITAEQEKEANSIPVESLTSGSGGKSSSGTEYQDYIDTVVEEMQDKYNVNPYTTSLEIYTNMDRSKQDGVNKVMRGETYEWKDDVIQSGVSVLDSETGKILAIGAGRNRNVGDYNYATQGVRQPGSTAKPLFDYGPGIEYNNWSTAEMFIDEPYTYSGGREINNWDHSFMGPLTLRRALALSRNIPALKAFQKVDKKNIIEFVTNLGIKPEIENGTIHEAHSIGAFTGVNSLQMAAAYAAFSNGGYYNEPYAVSSFTYRETKETVKHKGEKKKVMSDATAYMISSVLQDVSLTGGGPIKNVAAKTGTTNFDDAYVAEKGLPSDAIRDSWVVGYTTKTVIGMWYGYNIPTSEYCLRNLPATYAKDRLFRALAAAAFEENKEEFKMPESVVSLPIIVGSNPPRVAPNGYTGEVTQEYFKKDYQPDNAVDANESILATPTGIKGTYSNNKVTLTWNAVNGSSNDNYGKLVYNVYLGNTLLKVVNGTSYTYDATGKTGSLTFKVVATYESYDGLASEAASTTVQLKEEDEEMIFTINFSCNNNTFVSKKVSKPNKNKETEITITETDLQSIRPSADQVPAECKNIFKDLSWKVKNNSTIIIEYQPAS